MTYKLKPFKQVVPRLSAVVFGAVNAEDVGLDADHSTMAKYADLNDPDLQDIIKRMVLFCRHSTVFVHRSWDHWLSTRGIYGLHV